MQVSVVPNQWKSGLCDCCATPGCCMAFCCPCCIYGQIVAAMGPHEAFCGGNFCGACCCFYSLHAVPQLIDTLFIFACSIPVGTIAFPLSTIIHCPARRAIRQKFNISGDDMEDCLTVWCCICCALAQVSMFAPLRVLNADRFRRRSTTRSA